MPSEAIEEPRCGNCGRSCWPTWHANRTGWCTHDEKFVRDDWVVAEWFGEDADCWREAGHERLA